MTLRYVQLRDYDGNVHFVPNGLIAGVTNMSRGYALAVVDVGVAYREDLDEAFAIMRDTAAQMRKDPEQASRILEEFELAGVERWEESAVVLRGRFKVAPLQQWNVRREYLRRLKRAFDEKGIEIPYPHLTIYTGTPKSGVAPAFPAKTGSARRMIRRVLFRYVLPLAAAIALVAFVAVPYIDRVFTGWFRSDVELRSRPAHDVRRRPAGRPPPEHRAEPGPCLSGASGRR